MKVVVWHEMMGNMHCVYVACLQIVECRRVLKWTYAYGFYLPEIEHAKKQFFEYLQGICVLLKSLGIKYEEFFLFVVVFIQV